MKFDAEQRGVGMRAWSLMMVQVTLSMGRYLLSSDVGVGWRHVLRMLVLVAALLLVSGVVWLADSGYERACTTDQLNGRRAGVCGSRLVDLLRVVCRSVYNKRSADCENQLPLAIISHICHKLLHLQRFDNKIHRTADQPTKYWH